MEIRFLPSSLKYRGECTYNTVIQVKFMMWKVCRSAARHYGVNGKQLYISNERHGVRWEVLGLSHDGVYSAAQILYKISDQSNNTKFNPPPLSLINNTITTFAFIYFRRGPGGLQHCGPLPPPLSNRLPLFPPPAAATACSPAAGSPVRPAASPDQTEMSSFFTDQYRPCLYEP